SGWWWTHPDMNYSRSGHCGVEYQHSVHCAPSCPRSSNGTDPCCSPGGEHGMAMPLRQTVRIGTYLFRQRLSGRTKFPLIVELEPLFACNLSCEGCGKIQHPAGVLKQRMPVAQAVGAVLESGAPMVSIAGGEPLM